MTPRTCRILSRFTVGGMILALTVSWTGAGGAKDLEKFATRMAKDGNWREAVYRWKQAVDNSAHKARVYNNLGVAMEVLGDPEEAGDYYRRALSLDSRSTAIQQNYVLYQRAWGSLAETGTENGNVPAAGKNRSGKSKGKTATVGVPIPVPPRLDVTGMETFLVASFQTLETELLDTNREMVRFVRREIAKYSGLDPVQASPPPAIPEQTLDALISNDEFWRHLGREYGADLLVSGVVDYDRKDISGYENVDVVSSTTGQKVRTTRFVEKEEFAYKITVLFLDGKTGELLFRDDLRRAVTFQGMSNDPITAFHQISEIIAGDIVAVVAPRSRVESRFIFEG